MKQFNLHQHTSSSSAPPKLSTINLSSNNFSKELANLASLTNSSDNTLENQRPPPMEAAPSSVVAGNSCDNQFSQHSVDIVMDLSITAPSSVDSALCVPCNGGSVEAFSSLQKNRTETVPDDQIYDECNVVKNEHHPAISSSASSTSSGNYSASTPPNMFESSAFSSNYLCTLLANLENEVALTQQHLDDENDKRHKYKVMPKISPSKTC